MMQWIAIRCMVLPAFTPSTCKLGSTMLCYAARMPSSPASTTAQAPSRRDPALDGVRGLAVLLVFIYHYGGGLKSHDPLVRIFGTVTQAGWTGVILFFALSGFLITGELWDSLAERHLLRNFYVRRALRILPLYVVAMGISLAGALAHGHTDLYTLRSFGIYLLFLQDIPGLAAQALHYSSPFPLYHLWSLAVEEQFYLLWPAALLWVDSRRSARDLCLRIFALSLFFRLLICLPEMSFHRSSRFDDFVLTHAGALALGGALALALRSRDRATGRIAAPVRFVRRYCYIAFWAGIAVFCACGLVAHSFLMSPALEFIFGVLGASVASVASIAIALRRGRIRGALSWSPLGWLGRISYGFYVFHILLQPVFDTIASSLTHSVSGQQYQLVRMLVAFPLSVIFAALSFYLLEQPFLRLGRRFPMRTPVPSGLHLEAHSTRPSPGSQPPGRVTPPGPFIAS
jgi:peptidoglycan/LPS O-acetylase OafA/YrhL